MIIEPQEWIPASGWRRLPGNGRTAPAYDLVLAFGDRDVLESADRYNELRAMYPQARIITCSTSGEIIGNTVQEGSISVTAIAWHRTRFTVDLLTIDDYERSSDAGERIGAILNREDLAHVLVFADGQHVNGSDLVRELTRVLPDHVAVTGGLAGDGTRFKRTLIGLDAPPSERNIVVVGLYGTALKVGFGSIGGWDSFGPDRIITASRGNVLYEIDGQPALGLYKRYLGELAAELPGSALLFPLAVRANETAAPIVRTVLSINEEDGSMTFAGDVPVGAHARLMKANYDRLIDGASMAARQGHTSIGERPSEFALLISCVGRRLVLGQRTEEEVDAVRHVLGDTTPTAGFYSYGEISPLVGPGGCELHNQTMTVTTFTEEDDV